MLRTHKELTDWQKSFEFCKLIYSETKRFPAEERYGLISQLRRAAVSVPSNIAEGYNRRTRRDYIRFLWMANGTMAEIETQLMLARELVYLSAAECDELLKAHAEVERMVIALIRSLERKEAVE